MIATPADTSSSRVITIVADLEGLIKSPLLSADTVTLSIFGPVSSAKIVSPVGSVPASNPVIKPFVIVNVSFVPPKLVLASKDASDSIVTSSANELARLMSEMLTEVKLDPAPPSIFHAKCDQSILSAVRSFESSKSKSCPLSVKTRVVSA